MKLLQEEQEKKGEQPLQSGSLEQSPWFCSIRHFSPEAFMCSVAQQGDAARRRT